MEPEREKCEEARFRHGKVQTGKAYDGIIRGTLIHDREKQIIHIYAAWVRSIRHGFRAGSGRS